MKFVILHMFRVKFVIFSKCWCFKRLFSKSIFSLKFICNCYNLHICPTYEVERNNLSFQWVSCSHHVLSFYAEKKKKIWTVFPQSLKTCLCDIEDLYIDNTESSVNRNWIIHVFFILHVYKNHYKITIFLLISCCLLMRG